MNDLNEEWDAFNIIDKQPSYEDLTLIMTEVLKMHTHFYEKYSEIGVKPWSATGREFGLSDWEPMQGSSHTMRDFWVNLFPKLVGETTWFELYGGQNKWDWKPDAAGIIEFMDESLWPNQSAGQVAFFERASAILNSRPLTIIHGDLNSGNVWQSKKDPKKFLIADWQLTRMAPIGMDFFTCPGPPGVFKRP